MPSYEFVHCDVFTDEPFGGNPLAVFPDADGIDAATMQRIATELNLSETVFVLPSGDDRALRRLRIFTPGMELPLAGHPVIGAWYVLAKRGVVSAPAEGSGTVRVMQELQVGVLPVGVDFERGEPRCVVMTQPGPEVREAPVEAAEVGAALGLAPGDVTTARLPVVRMSAGTPCLAVALSSRDALARCRPDRAALDALLGRSEAVCLYAVFLESARTVHARMFGSSALGIVEDPATGGAAGPLGGALYQYGLLERAAPEITIEQGVDMGRRSVIEVSVSASGETVESVHVSGASVVLAQGTMSW